MGLNYHVLSKYRTELMGAAIFWVMLFHSFDLNLGFGFLNRLRVWQGGYFHPSVRRGTGLLPL